MNVGDNITARAFTDCFGVFHSEVLGLSVQSVTTIPAQHGMAEYDRILATDSDGCHQIEGAERFFEEVQS